MAKKKESRSKRPAKHNPFGGTDVLKLNMRDVLKLLETDNVVVGGKKLQLTDSDEDLDSWERIAEAAEEACEAFEETEDDDFDDDDDDIEDEDEEIEEDEDED